MLASQVFWNHISATVGLFIVIAAASIAGVALVLGARDLKRFGQVGAPWSVALFFASTFGGAGYWVAGPFGLFVSSLALFAFGWGRYNARVSRDQAPIGDRDPTRSTQFLV